MNKVMICKAALYVAAFICVLVSQAVVYGQQASPGAQDYYQTGLDLATKKKFAEAYDAFRRSERLAPERSDIQHSIGLALLSLRKPSDALLAFRKAVSLSPSDGKYRTSLCVALSELKLHNEAIKECEEGARLSPDSDDAQVALFVAMRRAGRPTESLLRVIDLAVGKFRDSVLLLQLAAEYYAQVGNPTYAAELYERLVRIDPSSSVFHGRLAYMYMRLERDENALASARRSLQLAPDNPFANYAMGRLFFELGQHDESSAAFKRASQTDFLLAGENILSDADFYRAVSEHHLGRTAEAISLLRGLTERFPDNYEYYKQLGDFLNDDAKYSEAIVPLRTALGLNPKHFQTLAGLGLALFESARFDEGISVLEEADRLYPGNGTIAMFLRVARNRKQNTARIPEMLDFAERNPKDLNVRLSLASSLTFAGRAAEAEKYVSEIWAMNPKDINVYSGIATDYSTAGLYDKALVVYRRSLELEENPTAYLGMAAILEKRGERDEAARMYEKVIQLKPHSPNVMKLYADLLRDSGKRREALEMYKRSLAIQPVINSAPAATFNAGLLSAKLGEMDAARQYLETLRSLDPFSAKTLQRCIRLNIWR
ncbi:MAG TPA: tetratricopeptide repeat protein [Pyrinomonadaceae bacterium]|nr:tetratricopeptide repeat protein [Pyrinomonadaceae bacterium]